MEARVHLNQKEFFSYWNYEKTTTIYQVTGGNTPTLVVERMKGHFLKNSTPQENIRISRLRKTTKLIQKENFKPEIKAITENIQDEFYQSENKQSKRAKFCAKIRWKLECQKYLKIFFNVLERRNLPNQTIFEL